MFRDESLEKLERKLLTMPSYQCSIFISYQWRQKEIAKALQKTFEAKTDEHGRQKYLVIRDEDFLTDNVYIKNFMKIITHPKLDYVLPIVSASYFESENCMYEVDKILKRYCWDSSLLPYVVTQDTNADAHLYSDPTKYKRHWQQKLLTEVDPKRREVLDNIIRNIDRFITVITARMRTPEETLILNDYQAIFEIVDRNESKKSVLLSEETNLNSSVDTRDDHVPSA
ncbi:MAG: toll/interleukin-1 receptor domain-containing protein, partial [Gammaproteobacteria bacterium]|nr:toll/interleukin-1 receptor domain-containing protein [Gammaproteobacteria bacterium]